MGTLLGRRPFPRTDNGRDPHIRAVPALAVSPTVWEQRPVRVRKPKAKKPSVSAQGSLLKPKRQPGWLDRMCGVHPLD